MNTKDIQRRIKSVNNIKKITRAMELVAAAKMRKAIEAVLRTRTYANLSWETVLRLAQKTEHQTLHPLLSAKPSINKVGVIVMTANRGLCGGFNANLLQTVLAETKKYPERDYQFMLMGRKGRGLMRWGKEITAEFDKPDLAQDSLTVSALGKLVINSYLHGELDQIILAYTDFIGSQKQLPRLKTLLPIELQTSDKFLGVVGESPMVRTNQEYIMGKMARHAAAEYLFEPDAAQVLERLLPQLLKVQLYQALLETTAAEHSARLAAMHQATEAAGDIVSELTLSFNKTRQAAITREIAEISAGVNNN